MAFPSVTNTFTNGTTADATQVNQNFTDLVNALSDGTKSISISALTCGSTATLNGAVNLGASTSNLVTWNGSLNSDVPVNTNTSLNFGSSTKGMLSYYLGGTSTFTLRLKANTMGASYTLTFPAAVPASTNLMQMDTGGNVSVASATRAQLPTVGQQISSSCSTFSGGNSAITAVTNLTVTITTTGRPVLLFLQPDTSGNNASLTYNGTSYYNVYFFRGGAGLATYSFINSGGSPALGIGMSYVDTPAAGTYTYTVKVYGSNAVVGMNYMVLVAFEL